ncbi:MAG: photosynthetic reaction center cytochrome PufC [Sphingomonadaceae bacterium]
MKRTIALVATLPLVLGACELAPKQSSQNGFRGTGMNQIVLAADATGMEEVPAPPYDLPPPGAETAAQAYENVQVLGNISREEFDYTMAAITAWISPEEGCNYCHNPANMASDEVYTKVVARRMISMTQTLNSDWKPHTGQAGVTCWTCHRGNAIPAEYWTMPDPAESRGAAAVRRNGQNMPTANTAYTSLPGDFAARYLAKAADADRIKVSSATMHPSSANKLTTMEAEPTYALMNHMSASLGVNCTFCHNTQAFREWNLSTPQRASAWHGIRMVGDINSTYITPLASVFPKNRLGSQGDPFKVNCSTCHQGKNKPMGGAQMAKDYPALLVASLAAPVAVPTDDGVQQTQ